jgi:hypothetical protein
VHAYSRVVRRFGLAARQERAVSKPRRVLAGPPPRAGAAPPPRIVVRLWLPLTPFALLLAPFALLLAVVLAPVSGFAPPPYRVNPFAAVLVVGRLLLSLGGTDVDVDTPRALVRIKIF